MVPLELVAKYREKLDGLKEQIKEVMDEEKEDRMVGIFFSFLPSHSFLVWFGLGVMLKGSIMHEEVMACLSKCCT